MGFRRMSCVSAQLDHHHKSQQCVDTVSIIMTHMFLGSRCYQEFSQCCCQGVVQGGWLCTEHRTQNTTVRFHTTTHHSSHISDHAKHSLLHIHCSKPPAATGCFDLHPATLHTARHIASPTDHCQQHTAQHTHDGHAPVRQHPTATLAHYGSAEPRNPQHTSRQHGSMQALYTTTDPQHTLSEHFAGSTLCPCSTTLKKTHPTTAQDSRDSSMNHGRETADDTHCLHAVGDTHSELVPSNVPAWLLVPLCASGASLSSKCREEQPARATPSSTLKTLMHQAGLATYEGHALSMAALQRPPANITRTRNTHVM